MSSYDGLDLFSSGPHRFSLPGVKLRTTEATAPGIDGVRLVNLGRDVKRIEQKGRLVAENAEDLIALRDAISAVCDGRKATLIDSFGGEHVNMVIVSFVTAERIDIGGHFSLGYEINYVEAE